MSKQVTHFFFFCRQLIQNESLSTSDHILALNRDGVHFLDVTTHVSQLMMSRSARIWLTFAFAGNGGSLSIRGGDFDQKSQSWGRDAVSGHEVRQPNGSEDHAHPNRSGMTVTLVSTNPLFTRLSFCLLFCFASMITTSRHTKSRVSSDSISTSRVQGMGKLRQMV